MTLDCLARPTVLCSFVRHAENRRFRVRMRDANVTSGDQTELVTCSWRGWMDGEWRQDAGDGDSDHSIESTVVSSDISRCVQRYSECRTMPTAVAGRIYNATRRRGRGHSAVLWLL